MGGSAQRGASSISAACGGPGISRKIRPHIATALLKWKIADLALPAVLEDVTRQSLSKCISNIATNTAGTSKSRKYPHDSFTLALARDLVTPFAALAALSSVSRLRNSFFAAKTPATGTSFTSLPPQFSFSGTNGSVLTGWRLHILMQGLPASRRC